MGTTRTRTASTIIGLAAGLGCTLTSVNNVGYVYYFWGPEETLEALDASRVPAENRALAELERAMILLELGRYEASDAAATRAGAILAEGRHESAAGDRVAWLPEYHERVFMHLLEMLDAFALQDPWAAAEAADRALAAVASVDCATCAFDVVRVLAAEAYGEAGRYRDGLEAIAPVAAADRAAGLVAGLESRLEGGLAASQPTGLAPPPIEEERTVVAVLLLGRGPYKEPGALTVGPSETVRWYRYLPRGPQEVTWAALDGEDPAISVELADVDALAAESLELRGQRLAAETPAGAWPKGRDLRHWASLPASIQLVVTEIPGTVQQSDLVYYAPDGSEVAAETILWPDGWTGGRMYVVRRLP